MSSTWHFVSLVLVTALCAARVCALWPNPREIAEETTPLRLSSSFAIDINIPNAPGDLRDAANRALYWIRNEKLQRLVVGRGTADPSAIAHAKWLGSLKLQLTSGNKARAIAAEAIKPLETRDESYILTVPENGSAGTLVANSTLGLLRGLATFQQLWFISGGTTYLLNAPLHIKDYPAFVRTANT